MTAVNQKHEPKINHSVLLYIYFKNTKVFQIVTTLLIDGQRVGLYLTLRFANSLDPDQAAKNVGPDLDPFCLTLRMVFLK